MRRAVLVVLALLATPAAPAVPAGTAPRRIVSINPCVDAILMHVADAGQIAGISHYSKLARSSSITPVQAARFTATAGTAEEVVALAPDLVIAGAHVDPATIAALKRLRIDLLQLGVADTVVQSQAQIADVAAAAGHPARGAALNARIDAALAAARPAGTPVPALIWQGGGLVPGGGTLADELLRRTGFRNLSSDYGLKQWDVLPLEYLVARPPRLLFTVGNRSGTDRMLGHPVLDPLAGRVAVRPFAEKLLFCAGPTIIDAVTQLAAARRSL